MASVFVLYDEANMAEMTDALILGIFTDKEMAMQKGQQLSNMTLFEFWLSLEPEYISKCHKMGYSSLQLSKWIGLVECKCDKIINVKLDGKVKFTPTLDSEEIQQHPRFAEYKKEYRTFSQEFNTGE